MPSATIAELEVGMAAKLTKTYDEWDIYTFAALTGDLNRAHIDEAFAEKTIFRGRIAHGMLTASLVSAAIGMRLPGTGSIYLSQELHFLRPVRIGDTVTARIEVVTLVPAKNLATLRTTCTNHHGELLLDGTALVMPPKVKFSDTVDGAQAEGAVLAPASSGEPDVSSPPKKHGLLVGQRMTRNVVSIGPEATLMDARGLLDRRRIRHLPVVEAGRLVGLLSDRDVRQASLPTAGRPGQEADALLSLIRVRDVMAREVTTISPSASVGQASKLLVAEKVGALPVLHAGALVGILTVVDALEALVDLTTP